MSEALRTRAQGGQGVAWFYTFLRGMRHQSNTFKKHIGLVQKSETTESWGGGKERGEATRL